MGERELKGILFAFFAGAFLTLQGVANARISYDIGTWQAATLTQLTGFVAALFVLLASRRANWQALRQVKPLYRFGGAFAAIIIFGNVFAIQQIGVTLTISTLLIAQLGLTFLIDSKGWFGVKKQQVTWPHVVGIGLMIAGVVILKA